MARYVICLFVIYSTSLLFVVQDWGFLGSAVFDFFRSAEFHYFFQWNDRLFMLCTHGSIFFCLSILAVSRLIFLTVLLLAVDPSPRRRLYVVGCI